MVVKNSILHLSNGKFNEHEIVLNNLEGFIFESANAKCFLTVKKLKITIKMIFFYYNVFSMTLEAIRPNFNHAFRA